MFPPSPVLAVPQMLSIAMLLGGIATSNLSLVKNRNHSLESLNQPHRLLKHQQKLMTMMKTSTFLEMMMRKRKKLKKKEDQRRKIGCIPCKESNQASRDCQIIT